MAGQGQSRARHGRERLGRTRYSTAGQVKSGHGKAGQGKVWAGLDRMGQNKNEEGCKAEQYEQKAKGRTWLGRLGATPGSP